jgi:hypothetical protein
MSQALPEVSIQKLRGACFTFPSSVGLGWDKLHPRAIARCSDFVLSMLITLCLLAEASGSWYGSVGIVMVVLIPKSDGGRRPIGLLPTLIRLWMRVRLEVAQEWVAEHERPCFKVLGRELTLQLGSRVCWPRLLTLCMFRTLAHFWLW